ncbi:beta-1,6-N-acetylglucosaminyltransferase [Nocardioides astragali]|uniref:Peptide O-xylosyltransferase n=1 Tax=Nocardioides astragali TaxID=1776736 RepID=A0ABW2N4K7_9ACTN|nr:beta-1,6-N-acetylglucosaminyltransferase [Nocardioides astragali]
MSRHAYLVLAHDDPYVLVKLLQLLDDRRNTVFVHLDKRFTQTDPSRLAPVCTRSEMVFVPRRKVFWGDFSQVDAALRLFRAAAPGRYDYYHLVSGADLPLKTQDEIHDFFSRHAGREFIGYAERFDPRWATELHFFNRYMRPTNRVERAIRSRGTDNVIRLQRRLGYDHARRFGLELRKGSDWFSITHLMALHLLDNEKLIRRLLRFGHAPSELYVQTLAWNSEFRARLFDPHDEYAGSARLIDWDRGGPYVFTEKDFGELLDSDRMFARKFMSSVDRAVVDRLVEHLS